MKLYEINAALEALLEMVDPETGELVCDMDQLEELTIAREEKLEGLALYTKNMDAMAKAIREEEKALAERRRNLENRSERAKNYLTEMLAGEKLTTSKVAVSYRKSEAVELGEEFLPWAVANDAYLRYKDPEPDKAMIKSALKAGIIIPGAELVSKTSVQIK